MFSIEVNRNILKDAGFLKVEQLTPIKKKFYYKALKMKKRVKRLENLKTSFKKKLQLITKSQKNSSYSHLSNKMNKSTLNFIESQIINQQRSPNGRRYKLDDKIFALSIYKTSPKAYSFLSNMFALPVESTLNSIKCHLIVCGTIFSSESVIYFICYLWTDSISFHFMVINVYIEYYLVGETSACPCKDIACSYMSVQLFGYSATTCLLRLSSRLT